MSVTVPRFTSRTLEGLRALLVSRHAATARLVENLRVEAAEALSHTDRSDLLDEEDPAGDCDATNDLMLAERASRRLWDLELAMARLDDGSYGVCGECGRDIPLRRLRALPATTTCVRCSREWAPTSVGRGGGTDRSADPGSEPRRREAFDGSGLGWHA